MGNEVREESAQSEQGAVEDFRPVLGRKRKSDSGCITPPDKLTKTQKKIWTYMKFHPGVTNYRAIAQGAGVTRHTAAKWYEIIRGMLGQIKKTTDSAVSYDCSHHLSNI